MTASDPSIDQLAALWESGFTLDSAWIEFAEFFGRYSYRALRTYPANDPDVLAHDPRYSQLQGWLPKTWAGRKEKLLVTARNERHHLLDELYAGNLWAVGFRTLPSGSDEPVRVPRRHFLFVDGVGPDISIDWARAEVRDGDGCYFDIRIVKPPGVVAEENEKAAPEDDGERTKEPQTDGIEAAEDVAAAPKPQPEPAPSLAPDSKLAVDARRATPPIKAPRPASPAPKGGRPSTDAEIRRKVKELWGEPVFRTMKTRLDQAREVRARLKGEHTRYSDDMQGYTSSFIKRIIGEVATELGRSR